MKSNRALLKWCCAIGVALALGPASICLGAPSAIMNNFNSGDIGGWGVNFGTGTVTSDSSHGTEGSGCLKFVLSAADAANKEIGPLWDLGAQTFNSADYVTIEYDLMIDAASGTDATGSYGNWQEVLRDSGWSWDSHWVGALGGGYSGAWTHMKFAVPNNAKGYPHLGFALQGTAPYSGDVIGYIDNIVISPFENPLVIGTFADATEAANWTGAGLASVSFSSQDAAGSASSGSLRVDAAYDPSNSGWQEAFALYSLAFAPSRYTFISFDLFLENPNSGTSFGILNLFTLGWASLGGINFDASNVGKWTHYQLALPTSVMSADGLRFQFGGNGLTPWIYYLDIGRFSKPLPPPVMGIKKAGLPGVQTPMDDNTSQWQREAICTPSGAGASFFWTYQGFPITYSYTISSFPEIGAHPGFEAHLYIVNEDTIADAPAWNETYSGADWNAADILVFRIKNGTGSNVICSVDWKTNLAGANPPAADLYHPVVVEGATAIGTWSLTFTDNTHGTVTGPGITATNFTLPDEEVLNNFNPSLGFLQFGMYKNDVENDGHNNQARGTFSQVGFSGTAYPINDTFNGSALTNNYAWRVTKSPAVTYVPPGTAWWANWTLPADGFSMEIAPALSGPWSDASVTNTYQNGAVMYGAVADFALPTGNSAFFRLSRPQ